MAAQHLHDVPDDLYHRLTALARANRQSLDAQAIVMLDRALKHEVQPHDQAQLLAANRQHRFTPPPDAPDSTALIREERGR